jgi:hypothetical protein
MDTPVWRSWPAPYYVVLGHVEHQRALHRWVVSEGQAEATWVGASFRFQRCADRIRVSMGDTEVGWLRPEVTETIGPLMDDMGIQEFQETGVVQVRRLPNGQPRYLCHVWPYDGPLYAYEKLEQFRVPDWKAGVISNLRQMFSKRRSEGSGVLGRAPVSR